MSFITEEIDELSSDDDVHNETSYDVHMVSPAPTAQAPIHSRYIKPVPTQKANDHIHQRVGLASLVSTQQLPERYRSLFRFSNFNRMQSESFDTVYNSDKSCVISSPTGSGKTVLFELAIIKLLNKRMNDTRGNNMADVKILYMAPTKALCSEKYNDWCRKFQPLNCTVGLLTGDSSFVELDSIKKSNLIICTPEKWDALTRKWSDYSKLLDLVKLLLVDEIHFLREKRGTSLEVVITRMMTMSLSLRIIALSATVPNIMDVSEWLTGPNAQHPIETMIYDDTYRAVSLTKTVYGYKTAGTNNPFMMEAYLNGKLPDVLKMHSKSKPVMIFCPTRNSSLSTAKYLASGYMDFKGSQITDIPNGISKENRDMVSKGIAYHHAGLNLGERKFIEENFFKGNIKLLCSTSTLAVGVNLPAYLVIIKGTKIWNNGKMEEYNELDLMQMMGRAGRPQFEKEGACVIMTDASQKERYVKLVKGTTKLESSLHLSIYENLTAEITLKTITSLESAFVWLQSTFFYQRYLQNPTGYMSIYSKMNSSYTLDIQLRVYLKGVLDELLKEKLIELKDGEYVATVFGKALSFSYVLYETVKKLINANSRMNLIDCLNLLSQANEFNELRIKMAQKRLYKEINTSPLLLKPFDKKTKFDTPFEKVSLMIQYELGGIEFPKYHGSMKLHHEFLSEKLMVFKSLPRILKAAIEIIQFKKDAVSLISMMKFNRCVHAKSWETSSLLLRQFDGVGLAYAKKLMSKGIVSIAKAKELTRDKLEFYLGLKPGAGQKIFKSIKNLPELSLKIEKVQSNSIGKVSFVVNLNLTNSEKDISFIWNSCFAHINVITDNSGIVEDFRRLPLKKLLGGKQFNISCQLNYKSDYIKVHFNCDEIAGVGKTIEVNLHSVTAYLPAKPSPPSQLQEDDSFDFGDEDDGALQAILLGTSNGTTSGTHQNNVFEPLSNISVNNSNHDTDVDTSLSFMACHHKCANKTTCRHICCKEGIPTNKIKQCKHVCKDKSKCRHLCCREQFEYEQKKLKKESTSLRQNTLDLSFSHAKKKVPMPTEIIRLSQSPDASQKNEVDSIECDSDDNLLELLREKEPKNGTICSNKPTALPLVLRRIEKKRKRKPSAAEKKNMMQNLSALNDTAIKSKRLTTSRFFNTFTGTQQSENQPDLFDSTDSEEFSDSFDSALEKALGKRKRSKSVLEDINHGTSSNKINTSQAVNEIKKMIKLPRLKQQSNKQSSEEPNCDMQSAEDFVSWHQKAPTIQPLRVQVYRSIEDVGKPDMYISSDKVHDLNDEYETADALFVHNSTVEHVDAEEENGSTTMTSGMEASPNAKEILNFLDSDIEFD